MRYNFLTAKEIGELFFITSVFPLTYACSIHLCVL